MKRTNIRELAVGCDAVALCAFIGEPSDLRKIDYFQSFNAHWNKGFRRSVISINYKSPQLRKELQSSVEELFKNHFPSPYFIHNKKNWPSICRSLCNMEENLLQKCKELGYELVCKTMDHVSILPEISNIVVEEGADFYYTNGLGIGGCETRNFDEEKLLHDFFFPQTNFYFLNVAKVDYLYNMTEVIERGRAWEKNPSIQPNGYYITCEHELANMVSRNNLHSCDLLTPDEWKRIVEKVIFYNLGDPSFKNLSTAGILHWGSVGAHDNKLLVPKVERLV